MKPILFQVCILILPGRDSGVAAIESLISRRGTFDYIILETSGLADPGNLAPLFWVDEGLGSTIYLDGIVTLIDAKNILLSLDESPAPDMVDQHEGAHMTTAHLQISHADVLVINKSDSVPPDYLAHVEDRVRAINGLAKIHVTQYGQIPQLEGFLLDLHAYDGIDGLDSTRRTTAHSHIDPVRLLASPLLSSTPHSIHSLAPLTHSLTHSFTHPTQLLSQTISTITVPVPPLSSSQLHSLTTWLQSLLWDSTLPLPSSSSSSTLSHFSIHRLKGRITTLTGPTKMIQAVRDVFEMVDLNPDPDREEEGGEEGEKENPQKENGKIVLIGRGVAALPIEESLRFKLGYST